MSTVEIGFLALALTAFATFMAVVGFVSVWSRRPKATNDQQSEGFSPRTAQANRRAALGMNDDGSTDAKAA